MDCRLRQGFTLLEILIVMAIVLALASITLPVLHRARVKASIVKTRAGIASLETAISMYESDFGDYPQGSGNGCAGLMEFLQGPVENENWKGPYIRLKNADLDKEGNFLDAWRSPYSYKYPQSDHSNTPFTINSPGPDRKSGTKDDIGNW